MDVIYSPIIFSDVDDIVRAFDQTWSHIDSLKGDRKLSLLHSYHFVLNFLLTATQGEVARQNGKFMGVILSRVNGQPRLFPNIPQQLAKIDERLNSTPAGHEALGVSKRTQRIEEAMERQIHIDEKAPAEVELFVVAPQARGHGVGGKLWKRAVESFERFEAPMFYLHTDADCDVSFYDHHGMRRVAERLTKDHPSDKRDGGERMSDMYIYAGIPSKVLSTKK